MDQDYYRASHRHARITARKARLAADLVRGHPVNSALDLLDNSPQRAASLLAKVVRSAVANAGQKGVADPNSLNVVRCWVDEGPLLGGYVRWRPAARGRSKPYRKKTSHIHVELALPGEPQAKGAVSPQEEEPEIAQVEEPETVQAEEPKVAEAEEPETAEAEEPKVAEAEEPETAEAEEPETAEAEEPKVAEAEEPETAEAEEPEAAEAEEPETKKEEEN